jgi:hypothetical protein
MNGSKPGVPRTRDIAVRDFGIAPDEVVLDTVGRVRDSSYSAPKVGATGPHGSRMARRGPISHFGRAPSPGTVSTAFSFADKSFPAPHRSRFAQGLAVRIRPRLSKEICACSVFFKIVVDSFAGLAIKSVLIALPATGVSPGDPCVATTDWHPAVVMRFSLPARASMDLRW